MYVQLQQLVIIFSKFLATQVAGSEVIKLTSPESDITDSPGPR